VSEFDPYYTWLGIAPKDQPPTYYRLLGIDLFEQNSDVIANAADQRMVHLRTFQSGKHSAASQKILNEIAAARLCLLNLEKKKQYDDALQALRQKTLQPPATPAAAPFGAPPVARPSVPPAIPRQEEIPDTDFGSYSPVSMYSARRYGFVFRPVHVAIIASIIGAVLVAFILYALNQTEKNTGVVIPTTLVNPQPSAGTKPETTHEIKPEPTAGTKTDLTATSQPTGSTTTQPEVKTTSPVNAALEKEKKQKEPAANPPDTATNEPKSKDENAPAKETPQPTEVKKIKPGKVTRSKEEEAELESLLNQRLPVPPAADQERITTDIRALYKDAYKNNKKLFAATLFDKAKDTKPSADRYVLLQESRQLAVSTYQGELALEIIAVLAAEYQVSAAALRTDVLEAGIKRGQLTVENRTAISNAALDTVDIAISEDNFELARRLDKIANQLARANSDKGLIQEAIDKMAEIEAAATAFAKTKDAREALKNDPDDLAANATVGKYICLTKTDCREGLVMLLKSDNAALKALAKKDLHAESLEAVSQVKLGNEWWDAGIKKRAVYWYRSALPFLSGLERDKVESKLVAYAPNNSQNWRFQFNLDKAKVKDDFVRLASGESITSRADWRGACEVILVARTTGSPVKIKFGHAELFWGKEGSRSVLRVTTGSPDYHSKSTPLSPPLPNAWHQIRWVIAPLGTQVTIDNKLVFFEKHNNDLSGEQTISATASYPGPLDVRSIQMKSPQGK
jgi:hypothetical protein